VCLNLAAGAGSRDGLETLAARETRCAPPRVTATVDQLIDLGLLDGDGRPTSGGDDELGAARRRVRAVTDRLVAGLSEDDLATAVGILDQVRARAESLLNA
jgi:hypothetical protein